MITYSINVHSVVALKFSQTGAGALLHYSGGMKARISPVFQIELPVKETSVIKMCTNQAFFCIHILLLPSTLTVDASCNNSVNDLKKSQAGLDQANSMYIICIYYCYYNYVLQRF